MLIFDVILMVDEQLCAVTVILFRIIFLHLLGLIYTSLLYNLQYSRGLKDYN